MVGARKETGGYGFSGHDSGVATVSSSEGSESVEALFFDGVTMISVGVEALLSFSGCGAVTES